jgi:Tol biopolymer transport system component
MTLRSRWVRVVSALAIAAVVSSGTGGAAATGHAPSPCARVVGVATWSPSGKRIAFVGSGGRSTAICVADASGRHARPLRAAACPRRGYCHLIKSPADLHWLARKRLVYSDADRGLFAVPLAGRPKRFGASTDSYGTLSIDGRGDRLAFGSPGCPTCNLPITVLNVPTGTVVGKIGGPKTDNFFPSLSHDGKRVVFVQTTPTAYGVLAASVDGSNPHSLKQCGGQPIWSPTADEVACPGNGSMASALLLVSVSTDTATTLIPPVNPSDGVPNGHIFGWSPNGRRIALLYGRCGCRLDVIDLATEKLRQLLGTSSVTDVSWSPNSRQLLVTEESRAVPNCSLLWRLQADGGKRRLLRGCP